MISLDEVKRIFNEEYEASEGDFLYNLTEGVSDSVIEFEHVQVPEGWNVMLKEVDDNLERDSYGYGFRDDAKLIITVTDSDETKTFAIFGSYASFEGWNWEFHNIREVRVAYRTVNYWEEV